jgi:hypothetical protein
MFKNSLTRSSTARMTRVAGAVAGMAALAMAIGGSVAPITAAHADPKQFSSFVGVGSDTIQDVFNAFAGADNGITYPPITSSSATNNIQVTSWDAVGTIANGGGPCITPKAPGATIDRPNGSTHGRTALSRAIDGTSYGSTACAATSAGKPVSGLIDFARSSAGPAAGDTGTALTYIPFGRDGVTFAYYSNGVATPVTSLTRGQLTTIFTASGTGTTISGVNIVPCGIQLGSGTYSFWNTVTTASASAENTATTTCNNATTTSQGGRVEENNATTLKAKGDALVGDEVIVGFSAAQFIAQNNGRAVSTLQPGVNLGSISDDGTGTNIGSPYSGTIGSTLTPSSTFYNDGTFGRNVYVVLDTNRATGIGNNDIKSLFVGSGSAICSNAAQTTVNLFGFLTPSNCGVTTIQGSLIAGTF